MLCPISLSVDPLTCALADIIDIDVIRKHCTLDASDTDDLLQIYRMGAIVAAENSMHRTIVPRAHRWVLNEFPYGCGRIDLPRGKTQSVTSIVYYSNGSPVTLTGPSSGSPAGTDYREDLGSDEGGIIMPPYGETWPSVDTDAPAPVAVNYSAGWTSSQIPGDVKRAILFAISDAVDIKGTQDFGSAISSAYTTGAPEAILSAYRLSRWY